MIQFESKISSFENVESKVYKLHLPIPIDTMGEIKELNVDRFICTINNTEKIHSGIMSCERYRYILINKKLLDLLGLRIDSKVSVTLEEDHSRYGMELPQELEEVLLSDTQAEAYFQKLTPGKQRNLIFIVANVKNIQSRINKSLAIAEHLRDSLGQLDFKVLNEVIKKYNNKDRIK